MIGTLFFNRTYKGRVLEMGVPDGCWGSHSVAFERRGWSSILVEADPGRFKNLRKARAKATVHANVVCSEPRRVSLTRSNLPGLSFASSHERDSSSTYSSQPSWWKRFNASATEVITTRCRKLSSILAGVTKIDVWFLDCEGCELDALRSVDFGAIDIGMINIEAADPSYSETGAFLRQHGFHYWLHECRRSPVDRFEHEEAQQGRPLSRFVEVESFRLG